jgi:hypothetical protein
MPSRRFFLLLAVVIAAPLAHAFDTVVVFNEIHYHPTGADNPGHEFVELYNQQSVKVDLTGWRLSGGIEYEFLRGTVIEGGGYLVVAADPAVVQGAGVSEVLGPYTGFLENRGERIRLRNNNDRIMDEIEYNDRAPWPVGADGSGASLSKIDPRTKGTRGSEWADSVEIGGTPGGVNFRGAPASVSLNEVAGDTAAPGAYFIEIFNAGGADVELGGYLITSQSGQEHVIAEGVIAPHGGHVTIFEADLGFRVTDNENLYFYSPARDTLLDALRADDAGRARYPDGGKQLLVTGSGIPATPGTPNAALPPNAVVINEIMYHHAVTDGEEWIELCNTLEVPVPVGGWELEGAVRFTIPDEVMIPARGYLVLARDRAQFSAKYPSVPVRGDYSGSLSNRGDDLWLLDAAGNPADHVFYRDGKPWPAEADGGGSSLELRNPLIDNSEPAAWKASDNAAISQWHDYEFTIRAARPTYSANVFNFHELRLGLLDSGVIMVDDFSVVEDPSGTNIELIANGDFSLRTGWRLLGTHKNSRQIADEGSRVLRLVAEGRMNYLNNLIETNLTRNGGSLRPVQPGKSYRVSFRAKWLSGSPQFRFELYYNQIAKTVILSRPERQGTPGEQNSTFQENTGPIYRGLTHSPAVPAPNEAVEVSTAASDPSGISSMTLRYALNDGGFSNVIMTLDPGDERWKGTIPGQSNGTVIQFYVEGRDGSASSIASFAPAGGRRSRALIKVDPSTAHGTKQSVRIIMLPSDATALHVSTEILSNYRLGCTLITDEENIAYDSGIRLRGSMWSRRDISNTALNLKFPADRSYRGVHSTITTRRGNRGEILVKHIINQAGGIHDSYNDILYQYGHLSAQNGPVRSEMARFGSSYLRGLPGGNGTNGTVFKMEGIREFQQQAPENGTNTPKLPFPIGWRPEFDIADQGDDKEMYRHNMRINSNFEEDDYTSIIRMCKTFSLNGQALEDAVPGAIDVDGWCRQFAALSLCGISDTYSRGNPHNLNFYVRPSDGVVESIPWDWDHFFNQSNAPLWGNRNVSKIFARPVYTRLYHGHLYDIIRTTYNTRYLTAWFAHYGECSGENYAGNLSYVASRADFVLARLPSRIPFAVSTNGGGPITTPGPTVTIEGQGWINVREILIDGTTDSVPLTWTDGDSWELTIPVEPGMQTLVLRAVDHGGRSVGSASVVVDVTGTIEPAGPANLAIGELMYNPLANAAEEFVEIVNISASGAIVDLTGVAFVNGIDFAFPADARLGPGERLLVVEDLADFEARYGVGLPVVGVFSNNTRLNNGGERVRLETITGETIRDFVYDNREPWPVAPDSGGFSLVLIAPESDPNHSDPSNWRSSVAGGGHPNDHDGITFTGDPNADDNGDGLSNFMNYALGPGATGPALSVDDAGRLLLAHSRNLAADDLRWSLELSGDLQGWTPAGEQFEVVSESAPEHGITRVVLRRILPLDPATPEQYIRLRVENR